MAVIYIVASGGPVGPGEIAAGGTITVVPGNTYVFTSGADANTTFETGGGPATFEVLFEEDNSNNFDVEFAEDTNPQITVSDDVDLSSVKIDAQDAQSVEFTAGDNVSLEEYKGSDTGTDTIRIGDDFNTTKDFKTGDGNDDIEIGNNATLKDLEVGDGNNVITIGDGLDADNIDLGDGNNTLTIGDNASVKDIKTDDGDNFISIGDGLDAKKIETGDGNDSITIGDGATIKDLKTDKGDDNIVIGDDFSIDKIEAGDGDDLVKLGADGEINKKLDGGKGDDKLVTETNVPGASNFETIVCFAAGTLIKTDKGAIPVETLQTGDMVVTLDHGLQPVRWVGSTRIAGRGNVAPIRIAAGTLGNSRDLLVSPQHRILVKGWRVELVTGETEALVAAKHLVNGTTIRQVETDQVTYVHVMFDTHEIIFSEGVPSESFHPGDVGMGSFSNDTRQEILSLFPALQASLASYGPSARHSVKGYEARVLAPV